MDVLLYTPANLREKDIELYIVLIECIVTCQWFLDLKFKWNLVDRVHCRLHS